MDKAFITVSAVLAPKEFNALSWGKAFIGSTKEHEQVRARVLDSNSKPIDAYQGIKGYRNYADKFCESKMDKAFKTVSAVLIPKEFKSLNWGKKFIGSTKEHEQVRARVLDSNSKPIDTYLGIKGYRSYSDKFCLGTVSYTHLTLPTKA